VGGSFSKTLIRGPSVPARRLILTARLEAFLVCETCSLIFQLAGTAWRLEAALCRAFCRIKRGEGDILLAASNLWGLDNFSIAPRLRSLVRTGHRCVARVGKFRSFSGTRAENVEIIRCD
jgi:hypothetical protein